MPRISGTVARLPEIRNFHRTMEETVLVFTFVATLFAAVIAFGVICNTVSTERSRELASLRVLGDTRGEISYVLRGELALLTLIAVPIGLYIGPHAVLVHRR